HGLGRAEPLPPDLRGALDGVKGEIEGFRHRHTLPASTSIPRRLTRVATYSETCPSVGLYPRVVTLRIGWRTVRSGLVTTDSIAVLAAGVGLRHGSRWLLRSVSFRMNARPPGGMVLGIAGPPAAASAVVDLLAGLARPAHGELRVLGKDLTTPAGRAAIRPHVGIARSPGRPESMIRIRSMIEPAARAARVHGRDRAALTAAALDRLALTPWRMCAPATPPGRSAAGPGWPPLPCASPSCCSWMACWMTWPRGNGPALPLACANWPGTPSSSRPGTTPSHCGLPATRC